MIRFLTSNKCFTQDEIEIGIKIDLEKHKDNIYKDINDVDIVSRELDKVLNDNHSISFTGINSETLTEYDLLLYPYEYIYELEDENDECYILSRVLISDYIKLLLNSFKEVNYDKHKATLLSDTLLRLMSNTSSADRIIAVNLIMDYLKNADADFVNNIAFVDLMNALDAFMEGWYPHIEEVQEVLVNLLREKGDIDYLLKEACLRLKVEEASKN